jgi:hypothetical protein
MTETAPPIFIVGSGRSGTSLLRALLNAHPRIHLGQESGLLRWAARWPDLDAASFFSAWAQTAAGRLFQTEATAPTRGPAADAIRAILQTRAQALGRARWGDKTPLHALHLDLLWQLFPDARVLAVQRHPVATVDSLRRVPWSSGSVVVDALMVRQAQDAMGRAAGDGRLLALHFEELVARPEATLRRVLAHVGEPWSDQVLDHPRHADFSRDPRLPWLVSAERPLGPERAPAVALSPGEVGLVEGICPPAATGHAPWTVPARGPRLLAGLAEMPRVMAFLWRVRGWAMPSAHPDRLDARHQLRWLFSLNPRVSPPPGFGLD